MWNHNPILRRIPVFMIGLCCGLPAVAEEAPATFDCVITPSRSVDLGTPVPGQIHQVLVDRSDTVSAGQIVASLDSRLEEANLAIADFKAATDTELSLRRTAYTMEPRIEKGASTPAATGIKTTL